MSNVSFATKKRALDALFLLYWPGMGWYEELQQVLKTAGVQLTAHGAATPTRPDTKELQFTSHFQETAQKRGLTEADAKDVYYHGSVVKRNMMVKKYNGYEIGIYYFVASETGKPIITSVWKRGRR